LNPSDSVADWVLDMVPEMGAGWCPPGMLGVGIGGSATNDGGFGVARALGWSFLDGAGREIVRWLDLTKLASLRPPAGPRLFDDLTVAVDVQNPLLGLRGCTRVYGPQKGLSSEDFRLAERALARLAAVVKSQFHRDYAANPGAGAAGGLGFGLVSFAGAKLCPGFELFAHHARLKDRIRSADMIVTGEGAMDESTMMGKGVGQIAAMCRKLNKPCIGLAGQVKTRSGIQSTFVQAHGMTELTSEECAKKEPAFWLEKLAAKVALSQTGACG